MHPAIQPEEELLIEQTRQWVHHQLAQAEAGHNAQHAERVWRNARRIAQTEVCNPFVIQLAALLHDVADPKFHQNDEELGPRLALEFLQRLGIDEQVCAQVADIVRKVSWAGGLDTDTDIAPELAVVRDADRLDALGAIGIARTFHYGGFRNRPLYDPAIPPQQHLSKQAYRNSQSPTINHFYEKLLLLSQRMHTATGRALAQQRHQFMERFLDQFFAEWDGNS